MVKIGEGRKPNSPEFHESVMKNLPDLIGNDYVYLMKYVYHVPKETRKEFYLAVVKEAEKQLSGWAMEEFRRYQEPVQLALRM
jgi:hypothetical protein